MRKLLLYIIGISFLFSCGPQPEKQPEVVKAVVNSYAKYSTRDFKHLKINCDYGRLDVKVYQYDKPYVEVHETYRKYVNFEERGDSLIVYTTKTPKPTKENPIKKRIKIYVPDLDSYNSEISTTTFMNFRTEKLAVSLYNDYFRIYECGFKQLSIVTQEACKVVIDNENIVLGANIKMNEESDLNCEAPIGKFVLNKKSLNNVRITKISAADFKWVKE